MSINACVVHDKKTGKYFVFMTTDTDRTARQIINTYELRPKIDENFRQMKDFRKLEERKAYVGKSLPVIVKSYKETRPKSIIIYVGQYYDISPFLEFLQLYAEYMLEVRQLLDPILTKV